jgi:hypothetical protein
MKTSNKITILITAICLILFACKKKDDSQPASSSSNVQVTPVTPITPVVTPSPIPPCLGSWKVDSLIMTHLYMGLETSRNRVSIGTYNESFSTDSLIRDYYSNTNPHIGSDRIAITFTNKGSWSNDYNPAETASTFTVTGNNLIYKDSTASTMFNYPDSSRITIHYLHKL